MNHAPAQNHAPTDRGKGATTQETRPHAPAQTKLLTQNHAPCSEENTATSKHHQVQFGLVNSTNNDEDAITKQLEKKILYSFQSLTQYPTLIKTPKTTRKTLATDFANYHGYLKKAISFFLKRTRL
jgi:hypothetical protein